MSVPFRTGLVYKNTVTLGLVKVYSIEVEKGNFLKKIFWLPFLSHSEVKDCEIFVTATHVVFISKKCCTYAIRIMSYDNKIRFHNCCIIILIGIICPQLVYVSTNLTHIRLIKHEDVYGYLPMCVQCNKHLTIKHIILHSPKSSVKIHP